MEKGNNAFLLLDYSYIIILKLTDDSIRAAIKFFMNWDD